MEKKSSIIAIGLTIHNTPVDVREKLAIPEVGAVLLLQCCRLLQACCNLYTSALTSWLDVR